MSHLAYRDPWLYSGYGWTLAHHVEVFGLVLLRRQVSGHAADPLDDGPLRAGRRLHHPPLPDPRRNGCSALLCVRRFASVTVACASVVLSGPEPLLHADGALGLHVVHSAALRARRRRRLADGGNAKASSLWPFVGSGALLGASFFANALSGTFIVPPCLVEGIAAARRRNARDFAFRGSMRRGRAWRRAVLRSAATSGTPHTSGPSILMTCSRRRSSSRAPTSSGPRRFSSRFRNSSTASRASGGLLSCFATLIVLGRRLLANDLAARLAQFAVTYVAFVGSTG